MYPLFYNTIACHSDCETCMGREVNQCLSCASLEEVLLNNSCVSSCPPDYIEISRICYGNFLISL